MLHAFPSPSAPGRSDFPGGMRTVRWSVPILSRDAPHVRDPRQNDGQAAWRMMETTESPGPGRCCYSFAPEVISRTFRNRHKRPAASYGNPGNDRSGNSGRIRKENLGRVLFTKSSRTRQVVPAGRDGAKTGSFRDRRIPARHIADKAMPKCAGCRSPRYTGRVPVAHAKKRVEEIGRVHNLKPQGTRWVVQRPEGVRGL